MWVDARILNGIASRHPNPVKKEEVEFFDYMDTNTRSGTPGKSADASAATDAEVASPDTLSKLAEMLTGNINVSELDGIKRTFYEINPLKSSISRPWELPEEEYQQEITGIKESIANLKSMHEIPEAPDYPPQLTQTYATVTVSGRVVAKVDNQGVVTDWGALDKIRSHLPDGSKNGPINAGARADFIARALGGTVHKSPTALTQKQFDHLPIAPPSEPRIDYEALKEDVWYNIRVKQLADMINKRAAYLAALPDV